MPQYS